MTFKVKNNWPTLDVFYKTCSGANTKSWKMSRNRRNAWRYGLRVSRAPAELHCVFLQQAPLWPVMFRHAKDLCTQHQTGHVTFG